MYPLGVRIILATIMRASYTCMRNIVLLIFLISLANVIVCRPLACTSASPAFLGNTTAHKTSERYNGIGSGFLIPGGNTLETP